MIPEHAEALEEDDAAAVFEERGENLDEDNFAAWLEVGPFEEAVLRGLTGRGPKLLVGPRGCGKSTLLRFAKDRLAERGSDLPVLVNYARSLCIEPAFNRRSDAQAFFQDWLGARILAALPDPAIEHPEVQEMLTRAREFVEQAERDPDLPRGNFMGPTALSKWLEEYATREGFRNVVLLLDDAAHAFVPEQQMIFFNFLAAIRRPKVTYKAAIYPGVTEFAPTFNVGHDAKLLNAWISADSPDYLPFMRALLAKRLPDRGGIAFSDDLVDLFAVAAFGIPRNFIAMVQTFIEIEPTPARVTQAALSAIKAYSDQTMRNYEQLSVKLPSLQNYVSAGLQVRNEILKDLARFNMEKRGKNSSVREQAVELAIEVPVDSRLVTILNLMEYWGIVRRTHETVSMTQQYTKVGVNSGTLLAENALNFGQNPTIADRALAARKRTRQHSFKRVRSKQLLSPSVAETCILASSACPRCGTPPQVESAKFCSNCGSPLTSGSRYEALVKTEIDNLDLPAKKIEALRAIGIVRVDDVLRDKGGVELKKAKRVGDVWSRRIIGRAEEFISV